MALSSFESANLHHSSFSTELREISPETQQARRSSENLRFIVSQTSKLREQNTSAMRGNPMNTMEEKENSRATGRKLMLERVEESLLVWLREKQIENVTVSVEEVKARATNIFNDMKLAGEVDEKDIFFPHNAWVDRVFQRLFSPAARRQKQRSPSATISPPHSQRKQPKNPSPSGLISSNSHIELKKLLSKVPSSLPVSCYPSNLCNQPNFLYSTAPSTPLSAPQVVPMVATKNDSAVNINDSSVNIENPCVSGPFRVADALGQMLKIASEFSLKFTYDPYRFGEFCFESTTSATTGSLKKSLIFADCRSGVVTVTERLGVEDIDVELWLNVQRQKFFHKFAHKCRSVFLF